MLPHATHRVLVILGLISILLFATQAVCAQPGLPSGLSLPENVQIPPGTDVNQLLKTYADRLPDGATSKPKQALEPKAPPPPEPAPELAPPTAEPTPEAPLAEKSETAASEEKPPADAAPTLRDTLADIRAKTPDDQDGELPIFGLNLFEGEPRFEPFQGQAVPDDYRVGSGDTFRVSVWGRFEADYALEIDDEGKVIFPKVGPVTLAGLTYKDARELLVAKAESITGVSAAATLAGTRGLQVFVVGEARRPGTHTLPALSTVIHAVLSAGGPTNLGSLRKVVLRRGGRPIADLDLYGFVRNGETTGDRPLQNGDVVVIGRALRKIWLYGHVKRPAIYELKPGETIAELLDYAGGLEADADRERILVERAENHRSRVVYDVNAAEVEAGFALHDGDTVRVFPLKSESENAVHLYGHVFGAGTRAYRDGLRVADVIRSADQLKPEVELGYAVVSRETGPDRQKKILPFDLGRALSDPASPQNLTLRPRDEIYVFSRYQFRPALQAEVRGEVRQPGLYRFELGARLADLVRLAKGVTPEALLTRAELLRYQPDRTRKTLYVDLDKALAGDPDANLPLENEDEVIIHSIWDRTFHESVEVTGQVKRPGTVTLTQGMTVRELVFKAGGPTKDAYEPLAHLYRTDRTTKAVTIHTFDLGRALSGDPKANLVLQDLDRVSVHSTYEFAYRQKVVAAGLVNEPGEYPYATNMRVRELVLAAGGLREEAYLGRAELVRTQVVDGEEARTQTLTFDLARAMAGDPEANLAVKPYDKLFVKRIPEWRETWQIEVSGEVRFPGTYYIAKGEKLSSVLHRAGGYTPEAYPRGAVFTREAARMRQQQRFDELKEHIEQTVLRAVSTQAQQTLSPEETAAEQQYLEAQQALVRKLEHTKATGRVVLHLGDPDALVGRTSDITLEDGDHLLIPPKPQTVSVVGQVYNPTSILLDPENPAAGYYLDQTGGPTDDADEDQIYIVLADGTVVSEGSLSNRNWWSGSDVLRMPLQPGDTILVPDKVIRTSYMRDIRDITQILYQIAVTAGVAITVF